LDGSAFFDGESEGNISFSSSTRTKKTLAAVIDLRNDDEVRKGERERTEGSNYFYNCSNTIDFISIPILSDVDRFWEQTIASMDSGERFMATFQTIAVGGALDRAASRHLERGGLSLLYKIMMQTSSTQLAMALDACLQISESTNGRPIIFHCQKGKDRTGILAMLLQVCLSEGKNRNNNYDDVEIVESYAISGELLNEMPNEQQQQESSSSSSTIDWSYFRGSPSYAMQDTLSWIRQRYGTVEGYLDTISFDEQKRSKLRNYCR